MPTMESPNCLPVPSTIITVGVNVALRFSANSCDDIFFPSKSIRDFPSSIVICRNIIASRNAGSRNMGTTVVRNEKRQKWQPPRLKKSKIGLRSRRASSPSALRSRATGRVRSQSRLDGSGSRAGVGLAGVCASAWAHANARNPSAIIDFTVNRSRSRE